MSPSLSPSDIRLASIYYGALEASNDRCVGWNLWDVDGWGALLRTEQGQQHCNLGVWTPTEIWDWASLKIVKTGLRNSLCSLQCSLHQRVRYRETMNALGHTLGVCLFYLLLSTWNSFGWESSKSFSHGFSTNSSISVSGTTRWRTRIIAWSKTFPTSLPTSEQSTRRRDRQISQKKVFNLADHDSGAPFPQCGIIESFTERPPHGLTWIGGIEIGGYLKMPMKLVDQRSGHSISNMKAIIREKTRTRVCREFESMLTLYENHM